MKRIQVFTIATLTALTLSGCATTGQAAAPATAPAPAPTVASAGPVVLDNFEGQNIGGVWSSYDDVLNNKGSSKANPDPWVVQTAAGQGANGTDHFGKCWGLVTTQFPYGFAGVGYNFGTEDEPKVINLNAYKGIKFWMKGDGRSYNFMVSSLSVNKDYCYYQWTIDTTKEWTEYNLEFSKIYQPSWGGATSRTDSLAAATGVQFQTTSQPLKSFEFSFDEFSLY